MAYLCAGDPLLYGSFGGLLAALNPRVPVAIVPGVSSITACAAAAVAPLAQRDERLSIVPATLPEEELAAALTGIEAAAVDQAGPPFPEAAPGPAAARNAGKRQYMSSMPGWPSERVAALAAIDPATVPYFATALVRRSGPPQ